MATTLIYTISPYAPFTKIRSADVNQDKADIKARLNWAGGTDATTGLGDDNLQSNTAAGGGLTRATKLKKGTPYLVVGNDSTGAMAEIAAGPAGTFLSSGGSGNPTAWVGNPLTAQYNIVVGSATDVSNGAAQYSSLITALAACVDGDRVLVLVSYNSTESVTVTKKILFTGLGSSTITGTVTFATGSSGSRMRDLRCTDNVTINSGVNAVVCDIVLAAGKTFIDNSNPSDTNDLKAMQE